MVIRERSILGSEDIFDIQQGLGDQAVTNGLCEASFDSGVDGGFAANDPCAARTNIVLLLR